MDDQVRMLVSRRFLCHSFFVVFSLNRVESGANDATEVTVLRHYRICLHSPMALTRPCRADGQVRQQPRWSVLLRLHPYLSLGYNNHLAEYGFFYIQRESQRTIQRETFVITKLY